MAPALGGRRRSALGGRLEQLPALAHVDTVVHEAAGMKTLSKRAALLGLCLTTFTGTALADDDVDPVSDEADGLVAVQRGVQSPKGMLSARITLGINMSADLVGKPISLAPDIYYGVSDRLQLGLVHTGPMGWQSRPGLGLCLTGEDNGCAAVYDNVGFDVMYGLAFAGALHLSAHGTLYVPSFDPSSLVLALGAAGKYHVNDAVSLYFDPQIGIVVSDRDVADDALYVPLELQYQAGAPNTLKLLTGLVGSLSDFGDTLQVPVGVGAVRNVTERVDLGARFSFDNLLGKQLDGTGRADARSLALLMVVRT